jgi:GT2 family glycosyltransferase
MLLGGSNRPLQVLSLPQSDERRRNRPTEWNKAQTCNLGLWRRDFERIGGFEEGFVGYGLEDTDFVVRLIRSGVRRITLEHLDPVLHIWHPRRKIPEDNRAKLAEIMASERTRAERSVLLEGPAAAA